jgi:PadR family transcriptional regulator PadR
MSTSDDRVALLQGTLDLLILRTLQPGPAHGHSIAKEIERTSDDILRVEQGSLYPALHRLLKRGWIVAEEGTSENNRRAKFYRLTAKGRKRLTVETSKWDRMAGAIARILHARTEGTS